MQYWINQNGVQSGPHTVEELASMNVTAEAYVWRSGLEDWVKITALPELAHLLAVPAAESVAVPVAEPVAEPETPELPDQPDQSEVPENPELPEVPATPDQEAAPQVQAASEEVYVAPAVPAQAPAQPQYAAVQPVAPQEPCPPTNLAWGIITLVMCCMPLSVVAIVYSTKVKNKYAMGDIEGAKRASEISAWLCIASIISSLVCSPFISLLQLFAMQ